MGFRVWGVRKRSMSTLSASPRSLAFARAPETLVPSVALHTTLTAAHRDDHCYPETLGPDH